MTNDRIDELISECIGEQIYFWEHGGKQILMPARRFSSDLNAMNAAEKHLKKERNSYLTTLAEIIDFGELRGQDADWLWVCATPRQRAEAFLRVLGKWEEVQG